MAFCTTSRPTDHDSPSRWLELQGECRVCAGLVEVFLRCTWRGSLSVYGVSASMVHGMFADMQGAGTCTYGPCIYISPAQRYGVSTPSAPAPSVPSRLSPSLILSSLLFPCFPEPSRVFPFVPHPLARHALANLCLLPVLYLYPYPTPNLTSIPNL